MKLDLVYSENWERLNDLCRQKLSLNDKARLRVYKDVASAALEIIHGTAQFFSHKKSIVFVRGQSPSTDFLMPSFYKEAYQVTQVLYSQIEDVQQWVENLNKDTVMVVFSEDHAVTGEFYPHLQQLDEALNHKKIYSVRVSHTAYKFKNQKAILPYSVRICSWQQNLAMAIYGERFRTPPVLAHRQNWQQTEVLTLFDKCLSEGFEDQQLVEKFEAQLTSADPSIQAWFKPGQSRLWDRSVISFIDVSGEALAQSVFKKCQWAMPESWNLLETTNLCRWDAIRLYENWWEPLPTPNRLRGLLIFSTASLVTKDFAKIVLSAYEELKKAQAWTE